MLAILYELSDNSTYLEFTLVPTIAELPEVLASRNIRCSLAGHGRESMADSLIVLLVKACHDTCTIRTAPIQYWPLGSLVADGQ